MAVPSGSGAPLGTHFSLSERLSTIPYRPEDLTELRGPVGRRSNERSDARRCCGDCPDVYNTDETDVIDGRDRTFLPAPTPRQADTDEATTPKRANTVPREGSNPNPQTSRGDDDMRAFVAGLFHNTF